MAIPPSLISNSLSLLNSDPKRKVRRKARVVVAEHIISATDSQRGSLSCIVRNAGAEVIDLIRRLAFVPPFNNQAVCLINQ